MSIIDKILAGYTGQAYEDLPEQDYNVAKKMAMLQFGSALGAAAGSGNWIDANKILSGAIPASIGLFQNSLKAANERNIMEEDREYQRGMRERQDRLTTMQLEEAEEAKKQQEALRDAAQERAVAMYETADSALSQAVASGKMTKEQAEASMKRIGMYLDLAKKSPDNASLWDRVDNTIIDTMAKSGAMQEWLNQQKKLQEAEAASLGMTLEEWVEYNNAVAQEKLTGAKLSNEGTRESNRAAKAWALRLEGGKGGEGAEGGQPPVFGPFTQTGPNRFVRTPSPPRDQMVEDAIRGIAKIKDDEQVWYGLQALASNRMEDRELISQILSPTLSAFGINPSGKDGNYTNEDAVKVMRLIANPAEARRFFSGVVDSMNAGIPRVGTPEAAERVKKANEVRKAAGLPQLPDHQMIADLVKKGMLIE